MKARKKKPVPRTGRGAVKKPKQSSKLPTAAPTVPIRITPKLKEAAEKFIKSFGQIDYDEESIDICAVTLECNEPQQVEAISNYTKAQDLFIQESRPTPPPGDLLPQVKSPVGTNSSATKRVQAQQLAISSKGVCTVKNLHALHLGLEDLADKIAQTTQFSLRINVNQLDVLGQFAAAFSDVIEYKVWSEQDKNKLHEQEDAIKTAHNCTRAFVSALKKVTLPQPSVRVAINSDLSVCIGNSQKKLKTSLLRQLFVLAYLRDRDDFSLEEYSGLYGNGSGEPRKEFDQNNRKLAEALGLANNFWKVTTGRRAVDCIEWHVSASQDDLAQFLKNHAVKQAT